MPSSELIMAAIAVAAFVFLILLIALFLRRVVPTNEVHIIQSGKATVSYGKDHEAGNTYYEWPAWLPKIGIVKIVLPVSVFDGDLEAYEAYDKGRLPFVVDVKAFFRISDSNLAAQRVSSFDELRSQLHAILQGAVRTILASADIEEIMQGRSQFGEAFTREVEAQLVNWGVSTVKNIELMDIRDSSGSYVIKNIMEKKKSLIEMQSRIEVAENMKRASIAEIEAKRETDVQLQDALQKVGARTAEKDKAVGIANEMAQQSIKEQAKITTEKELEITKVSEVTSANITKDVQIVKANQDKETAAINKEMAIIKAAQEKETTILVAEGTKATTILVAEGDLESKKRESEGIAFEGTARAEAEKAMQLAPVQAQIVLAKEIGNNEGYQKYLVTIEQVKANQAVGIEQAKALSQADLKIIANSGNVENGMKGVMDIFSSAGGTNVGAMLEGLAQSEQGEALLKKVGLNSDKKDK
ncbi:MAG TPA: SPFH domain-containing protein [Arenimonas sp.]|nr:SPFH domain-containing protein [Arenimonas sp.]HPO24690.1 SPFH domain-containing protein [Arenimonas sp.]HPW33532.1 SPFH domain-containing protein [Arenimonas sp.]